MKKWTSLICVVAMLITLLPGITLPASAAETSGKCGDNLTWEISGHKLTISGTGPMYDFESTGTPWYSSRQSISTIVLTEGITSIGNFAFAGFTSFYYDLVIPRSVTSIGRGILFALPANTVRTIVFLGDAPAFAEDAFWGPDKMIVQTVFDWPEEVKQHYGGEAVWREITLDMDISADDQLVDLNYQFQPEDFRFLLNTSYYDTDYVPLNVSIGEYDNSTYGEKNVTITADGRTFDFLYYVTDGSNHLDLLNVEFPEFLTYTGNSNPGNIKPVVTIGEREAKEGTDYYVNITSKPEIGFGYVTIIGKGVWKDFSKTFYYPVLKANISKHYYYTNDLYFAGMPLAPDTSIYLIDEGIDYEFLLENNVNPGQATFWTVGLNNMYGYKESTFEIKRNDQRVVIEGEYIGQADGELSTDIPIYQQIIAPGKMNATINLGNSHVISYALYHLDGDELELILETTKNNFEGSSALVYDFSNVYEGSMDEGGEVYVLSYSWVRENLAVYAGMTYLIVPAKVPDATTMTMYQVENDGDFRNEYFGVYSEDGALGDIIWTSSDASVASVENGIVVQHKPGTTTITAQWGDLTQSQTMTVDHLDLAQGVIFDYREAKGARVIWDNRILEEGTDYILNVEKNGNAVTVTATGCGLFTGELMKEFMNLDSLADPHTHSFDNSCDSTCNGCDFTRDRGHTFSTEWSKDLEIHYHECTACGEKADVAEHILTENGKECTVCGRLWTPGDVNGDGSVNSKDVELLLWFTLFPNSYSITGDADYDGNGTVNSKDVEYLLWHTLFPNEYPL